MSTDIKHSGESNQEKITRAEGCGHLKEEKSSSLLEQRGNTSNGQSQGKQREQSEGRADGDVWTKHLPSGNRWGVPRSFLINQVTHTFWWVQATDLFITTACVQGDEKRALEKNKYKPTNKCYLEDYPHTEERHPSTRFAIWCRNCIT